MQKYMEVKKKGRNWEMYGVYIENLIERGWCIGFEIEE